MWYLVRLNELDNYWITSDILGDKSIFVLDDIHNGYSNGNMKPLNLAGGLFWIFICSFCEVVNLKQGILKYLPKGFLETAFIIIKIKYNPNT